MSFNLEKNWPRYDNAFINVRFRGEKTGVGATLILLLKNT